MGEVVRYPDESKSARTVYQAGRHNIDNNKFRFTPIYIIIQVGQFVLDMFKSSGTKKMTQRIT